MGVGLTDQHAEFIVEGQTNRGTEDVGIAPDEITIHVRVAIVALWKSDLRQCLILRSVELNGTVGEHFAFQLVGDGIDDKALLLSDAQDIVVEGGTVDDVPRRSLDIGSLIHADGWIPRTCCDGLLAAWAETDFAPGCGFTTTEFPAAMMPMALLTRVGTGWVDGVTAQTTP